MLAYGTILPKWRLLVKIRTYKIFIIDEAFFFLFLTVTMKADNVAFLCFLVKH